MKLLLLQDVKNVGKKGEIVEVSDGYARNFLLPKKLASAANEGTVRAVEKEAKDQAAKKQRELEAARAWAEELAGQTIIVKARVGEGGKLFGSITSQDVAVALKAQVQRDIDKRKLQMPEPLRALGDHTVGFKVHPEVTAKLKLKVVGSDEK